jgi:tetratricopeptide (TPR) repeat protein
MKFKKMILLIGVFTLVSVNVAASRTKAIELTKKGHELNDNSQQEISFYLKAIDADSSYSRAYYNLGNIYFDRKNYNKAAFYFERAVQLNSGDPDYQYNLALTFYYDRKPEKAVPVLKELLKLKAEDYQASLLLATIYSETQSITGWNAARLLLLQIKEKTDNAKLKKDAKELLEKIEKKYQPAKEVKGR